MLWYMDKVKCINWRDTIHKVYTQFKCLKQGYVDKGRNGDSQVSFRGIGI